MRRGGTRTWVFPINHVIRRVFTTDSFVFVNTFPYETDKEGRHIWSELGKPSSDELKGSEFRMSGDVLSGGSGGVWPGENSGGGFGVGSCPRIPNGAPNEDRMGAFKLPSRRRLRSGRGVSSARLLKEKGHMRDGQRKCSWKCWL